MDTIKHIEITTRTRELLLEEEPEKFEVRAFDDEGTCTCKCVMWREREKEGEREMEGGREREGGGKTCCSTLYNWSGVFIITSPFFEIDISCVGRCETMRHE